ncbi:peptidase S51 [Microbulbifer sp. A4B17]|uniref:Type 1 glutamine amidotransferase-like domain-containing protein n=1 Tax=Microbulbifer sp. A4B17 TaxID=359370 RepID=UPI000D52B24D|nr:Type 1 glutamine amidotransferase-like domain-containing protein [Microbulbifer sp. A4B17]AWF80091.1 peptidase S51 [Microbulbifer sp. A4B17]
MTKLFLTSYFAEVAGVIGDFDERIEGKRVTFIPTASLPEEITFYVEDAKKALEQLGLIVDKLEVSTASTGEIEDKLKNNEYIYVTGGNTYFLLQELRRSGADKILLEQIRLGKPYIGESAGTVVLSPNIAYIQEMDNPDAAKNLESYEGLNLVNFYPLPHYGNQPFKDSAELVISKYSNEIELSPFSNNQLIAVIDGEVETWSAVS